MSDIKIQNFLMNHYADRIKSVNPNDSKTANTKYIDLNNNGRKDAGELLSENSNSDEFLKHVIYRENDVIKMKAVYEKVTAANTRTNALQNELESKLILKAALVASEVPEEKISEYVEKFDRLYAGYVQFKLERNTKPANKLQEIECLNKYLWKNGTGRAVEGANRFDQVLNNQLDYFENKSQKPGVGNCVGLTDLFNIMAIRAGIDVSTIILSQHRLRTYLESIGMVLERVAGHQYSLHSGIVFENTGGAGLSIRLSKDEVVSAYAGIASEFSNAGIMHFTQKEHEKAIAAFRTAIKLYPKNPDFYANLGNTYYFKRDYHQTLEAYNLASQLNPHNADYRICIGQCYLKLEKYDEAIEAFKIALELNPQDADAHYSLGNAYRDKKEYNQAIAAYEMAIKLKPKESRFYTTLAKVHLKKLISSNK